MNSTCQADGCDRSPRARGLCRTHYGQHCAGQPLAPIKPYRAQGTGRARSAGLPCTVDGCGRTANAARGLCASHYRRHRLGLPLDTPIADKARLPLADRMAKHTGERTPSGCLPWTGQLAKGYGLIRIAVGVQRGAHKVAWELVNGEVPEGMVLDHTCHPIDGSCRGGEACEHRRCVEVSHLAVTTRGDNSRRCVPHALR